MYFSSFTKIQHFQSTEKEGQQLLQADVLQNVSSECGVRPHRGSFKIVGGVPAYPQSWPWQVNLIRFSVDCFKRSIIPIYDPN